ncbi:MAG TPA: phosphatidylserine/phosphatidylglycerophosphate/cardiolipin synthase family protein, partial [Pyrinomonadaceae bacterium]|nr:phosphatidylserine/phosphatidylglycerophosphate/cardiolipin synthase family protein [Pyrinomonadaceae bacterium]
SNTGIGFGVAAVLVYLFAPREREPTYGLDHEFPIESEEFLSTIVGAMGMPFLPGNDLDVYNNGDEFYPVMLEAVREAKVSVCIEAYIYWAGEVGKLFAEAFAEKAREGVPVKILLDAVGSATIGSEILETLEKGGCQVEWYNPIKWYTIGRVNNRTHRKSLIIDGRVGFTGGAGIADHWLGHAHDEQHWRDIMVRLRGPAVVSLQTGFAQNWLKTTGELVTGPTYYPEPEPRGDLNVLSVLSSPETGSSTVRIMYYLSIACARKSIRIANPYFVPDNVAVEALVEAKRRGVDVKVMVAGVHNDIILTRLNSVRLYGRLLAHGIEIYEYNRTMMHHKYMVCDGVWATVGTTNFDNRSLALNEENNLCVYERRVAAEFEAIFERDLAACDKVEFEAWRRRGLGAKLVQFGASILKEQV